MSDFFLILKAFRRYRTQLSLVFLIFIFQWYATAQERKPSFFIGGYFDYNINTHKIGFNSIPDIANSDLTATLGNGTGLAYGGAFEYQFSDIVKMEIRLGFSDLSAKISESRNIGKTSVKDIKPPNDVRETEVTVDHILNTVVQSGGIEPTLSFKFFYGFNLFAGFRAAYLFTSRFTQEELIADPAGVTFLNGESYRFRFTDVKIPDANQILFHGVVGLRYDINLGGSTYLIPEIRYYHPFNSLSSSLSWMASSIQAGASLKLPIFPTKGIRPDTSITRDTLIVEVLGLKDPVVTLLDRSQKKGLEETDDEKIIWTLIEEKYKMEVPKPQKLTASIDITGVHSDGKREKNPTIIIEEVEYVKETVPLLPYVFFREASSDLSKTDVQLLTRDETSSFFDDSLKPRALVAYTELINIVGYRMKNKFPDASLTIVGCNNQVGPELENTSLSQDRAQAIADYLVNIWGIDKSRIFVQARNFPQFPANNKVEDGQRENQRAELYSNDDRVLAHVLVKSTTKNTKIPLGEITPAIITEAGLKSWGIEVRQNDEILRKYQGASNPPASIINWKILDDPIPAYDQDVDIILSAVDNIDQSVSAKTGCRILHKHLKLKGEDVKGATLVEKFYIIAHFAKSDLLSNQQQFLDHIKSRIRKNSKVTISGYADRTGNQQVNRNLAVKRVSDVENALNVPEDRLTRKPIGSDILLYDNDLPQGRCYSRTIQVTIETYID